MSKTFKNVLKTFESDITGEKEKYRVNNAVFLVLEEQFGLSYGDFDKQMAENEIPTTAKFVTAVMIANGHDVTYEEVMKNTCVSDLLEFYMGFFDLAFGRNKDLEELTKKAKNKRAKEKQ